MHLDYYPTNPKTMLVSNGMTPKEYHRVQRRKAVHPEDHPNYLNSSILARYCRASAGRAGARFDRVGKIATREGLMAASHWKAGGKLKEIRT
jgi:hypothetical protein